MNTMLKTLSLAVIGSFITVAGAQAAGFAGASSDESHIIIQPTGSSGPHGTASGDVGVRVASANGIFGQVTMGLPAYKNFTQNQIVQGYEVSTLNANMMPPNHRSLGNFDFAQVPNQEVYFGEWTADRSNPHTTHTVYYGGKNKADSLPNNGKVEYEVKGMNNYHTSRLMTGKLEANFKTNKIDGELHDGVFQVFIDNNTINPNDASFSGKAKAYAVGRPLDSNGHSQGHFFGQNGKSLAGIATFNNRSWDTSFGGTKVDPSSRAKVSSDVAARQ